MFLCFFVKFAAPASASTRRSFTYCFRYGFHGGNKRFRLFLPLRGGKDVAQSLPLSAASATQVAHTSAHVRTHNDTNTRRARKHTHATRSHFVRIVSPLTVAERRLLYFDAVVSCNFFTLFFAPLFFHRRFVLRRPLVTRSTVSADACTSHRRRLQPVERLLSNNNSNSTTRSSSHSSSASSASFVFDHITL